MRRTARRFHVESYRIFVDPGGFLGSGILPGNLRRATLARDRAELNVAAESRVGVQILRFALANVCKAKLIEMRQLKWEHETFEMHELRSL